MVPLRPAFHPLPPLPNPWLRVTSPWPDSEDRVAEAIDLLILLQGEDPSIEEPLAGV